MVEYVSIFVSVVTLIASSETDGSSMTLKKRDGKTTMIFKCFCFKVGNDDRRGLRMQLIDWKRWEDGECLSQVFVCVELIRSAAAIIVKRIEV